MNEYGEQRMNGNKRDEKFKLPPKSLCQTCEKKAEDCFHVLKSCSGNDQKLGCSFVTSCSGYRKEEKE
jgi:hypothetical protein